MARNWTELVVGFWIVLFPWLLGFSNIAIMKWSNVLRGLALILINAWMLFGKEPMSKEVEENNQPKGH